MYTNEKMNRDRKINNSEETKYITRQNKNLTNPNTNNL